MAELSLKGISLNELQSAANKIIDFGKEIEVWVFEGEMGAGKTTLIKSICNVLGVMDNVSSPTFSLVNEYMNDNDDVFYHFDFYRIETESEALDIGCDEYFYSGNYCFIEWPSKIPNLLPESFLEINISIDDEATRSINLIKHV